MLFRMLLTVLKCFKDKVTLSDCKKLKVLCLSFEVQTKKYGPIKYKRSTNRLYLLCIFIF